MLFRSIQIYLSEIEKMLKKAKEILKKAKAENFALNFDVDIEKTNLDSYQAIIFNRNQHEYVQKNLKKLEREYEDLLLAKNTSDLSVYLDKKEKINDFEVITAKADNVDLKTLKTIVDDLVNRLDNAFVFMATVSSTGTNYVCSSKSIIHAGLMMKKAMHLADGNGGGSEKFATGGSKNTDNVEEVLLTVRNYIEEEIKDRE